ncbi:MAG: hypothetical protein QNI99_10410 [Woeseiaceae bacterium]|nr:hypothetical protein [Woeseiaceae bacterium]
MAFSFPFRVSVWRKSLGTRLYALRRWALAIPAVVGLLILFTIIPAILSIFEFDSSPPASSAGIVFETDCDYFTADIVMSPFGGSKLQELQDGVAYLESTNQEDMFGEYNELLEAIGESRYDPIVAVTLLQLDEPEAQCGEFMVSFANTSGEAPTIELIGGGSFTLEEAYSAASAADGYVNTYTVDIENLDESVALVVNWPGLYQYSHQNQGWLNRLLGERSAALDFQVGWWRPEASANEQLPPDASIQVLVENPISYRAHSTAYERWPAKITREGVEYEWDYNGEYASGPSLFGSNISFRARVFEAKENFALLAGGALVGLGVTLIVETLIAFLFRLEGRLVSAPRLRQGDGGMREEEPVAKDKQDDESDGMAGDDDPREVKERDEVDR